MEMRQAALLLSFLLIVPAARAAEGAASDAVAGPGFAQWDRGPWELGIDLGMMYPTRAKGFSHVIDNQRAYDLLAAETVGDEIAEGFVPPPLPGSSVVSGRLNQLSDVGAHVYYRTNPWLSYGVDFGYGIRRDLRVQSRGIYVDKNFLQLNYSGNIIHASAVAKIGRAYGSFRPYLLIGPGAYMVQERAQIYFTDPDDPQLKPLPIIRKDTVYGGVHTGAGVEWRVERGVVGLDVSYHKVFAGSSGADFLEPKLRFAVLF